MIGLINTNSITNKFHQFNWDIFQNDLNTVMISEKKIVDTFLEPQFSRRGYCKPFTLDLNSNAGGI